MRSRAQSFEMQMAFAHKGVAVQETQDESSEVQVEGINEEEGLVKMTFNSDESMKAMIEQLRVSGQVSSVQPNHLYRMAIRLRSQVSLLEKVFPILTLFPDASRPSAPDFLFGWRPYKSKLYL
jgi:hypothetical protein